MADPLQAAESLGPALAEPIVETLAIVGLGLIGASLARVARQQNLARRVIGADADPAVRARARAIALGDIVVDDLREAVREADLVILCVPVGAMGAVAARSAPSSSPARSSRTSARSRRPSSPRWRPTCPPPSI